MVMELVIDLVEYTIVDRACFIYLDVEYREILVARNVK